MKRLFFCLCLVSLLLLSCPSCARETPSVSSEQTASDAEQTPVRTLTLQGRRFSYDGSSDDLTAQNDVLTFVRGGVYRVCGTLSEGALAVSVKQEESVRLILDGVSITSTLRAPFSVERAACVVLELADGSVNTLTDATRAEAETSGLLPTACAQIQSDLVVRGGGSLIVSGKAGCALAVSETVTVESGRLILSSSDIGLWVRDRLLMQDGALTVTTAKRGIVTDESEGSLGEIQILGGTLTAACSELALCAARRIVIQNSAGSLQAPVFYRCRRKQNAAFIQGEIVISSPDFPPHS